MAPRLGGIKDHEQHVCALAHGNDLKEEEEEEGGEGDIAHGLVASRTMSSMSALWHTAMT